MRARNPLTELWLEERSQRRENGDDCGDDRNELVARFQPLRALLHLVKGVRRVEFGHSRPLRREQALILRKKRQLCVADIAGGALPDDAIAGAVLQQRLRERREPADAAGERIGFVFADNPVRAAFAIGLFYRNAGAEGDVVALMLPRIDDDRRFEPFLKIFDRARCRQPVPAPTALAVARDRLA